MAHLQAFHRFIVERYPLLYRNIRYWQWSLFLVYIGLWLPSIAWTTDRPQQLQGVGITEHLGNEVKIQDLSFLDEQGKTVALSQYFSKKHPVILALVYYECPNLCNLLLNGLLESLKNLDWTVGNQFELVAVSINPKEKPPLAAEKKAKYLASYNRLGNRPHSEQGWHFLTGEEPAIQTLASQIGFQYRYDEKEKQYAHAAALFVLTPDGKISRYLYGISFKPQNIRFALLDASSGKIGTVMDRVLLFCFHYDPSKNSYSLRMWRIVQVILSIQVLALGFILYTLWKKEKRPKPSS